MTRAEDLHTLNLSPGSIHRLWLGIGESWTGPTPIPLIVQCGANPGPKVVVAAAQHGDEGYAVLGALELAEAVAPAKLRGQLWILPCLNLHGYTSGKRNSPFDQQDMNRVHPGSESGTITQQIAAAINRYILPGSDLLIDLHGGSPEVGDIAFGRYTDVEGKPSLLPLVQSLPLDFLLDPSARNLPGMWSQAAPEIGVPQISIEAGSAYRHAKENTTEWVEMVLAALRYLKMLPGKVARRNLPLMQTLSNPARTGGIFVASVTLGDEVKAGQKLGEVRNLLGEVLQVIEAGKSGKVAVMRTGVRVHPGESLVTLAVKIADGG